MNVKEASKENYSKGYTREVIEDSPLYIVGDENGYRIILGKYAVSPIIKTVEEAREYSKTKSWSMILNIMGVMANGVLEEYKQELFK